MKNYKRILEAVHRGIKLALDDYQDIEPNSSISQSNNVIDAEDVIKQKIELSKIVVDLGLPSGTLWCKYNLGSSNLSIGDAGNFYAWGETQPKETYTWGTYEHGYGPYDLYKYIDNSDNAANFDKNSNDEVLVPIDKLMVLQPEDDAATQNMHLYNFKFHIPTKEQFEELLEHTKFAYKPWSDEPKTSFGGAWLISKINGKKVFFPFKSLKGRDAFFGGYYWSSTLKEGWNNNAYHMVAGSNFIKIEYTEERCYGMLIRPVVNLD